MEVWVLFGTFVFLLLIGTPVAFCLGVASFATVLYIGLPPVVVFQQLNSGVSVFALMAIPFFIFAGELMVRGDIARRLVALAGAMVGHMRGGLGQVNITASVLFGGISGSAAADATAIGGQIVSLPWVSDTRVLFYRSDILAEAGIDAPPATWDQLRADAKTLAARGDGSYGYYIPQWDSALPVIMT